MKEKGRRRRRRTRRSKEEQLYLLKSQIRKMNTKIYSIYYFLLISSFLDPQKS